MYRLFPWYWLTVLMVLVPDGWPKFQITIRVRLLKIFWVWWTVLILISIIGPGKIEITELPIGIWTQAYKDTVLDRLLYRFNKTPPLTTLFNKQLVKTSAVENGAGDGGPKKKEKLIESRHERITHSEHILLRPGTYIGSVELVTELMWVYNKEKEMMIKKEITYFPRV